MGRPPPGEPLVYREQEQVSDGTCRPRGVRRVTSLARLTSDPRALGYIMAADVTSGIAAAEHSETGSGSREPRPTSDAPRCAPSSYLADRPGGGRQWRLL